MTVKYIMFMSRLKQTKNGKLQSVEAVKKQQRQQWEQQQEEKKKKLENKTGVDYSS